MPSGEGFFSSDDPLDKVLAPPANETPAEREIRLATEAEARRVSDMIDEELKRQDKADKKTKVMKLLLLGESSVRFWAVEWGAPGTVRADSEIDIQARANQVCMLPSLNDHHTTKLKPCDRQIHYTEK